MKSHSATTPTAMMPLIEDRRSLVAAALVISLATAVLIELVRGQSFLQPLELLGYDLGLALRPHVVEPPPITLIEITERDIRETGRWPLADADLARALTFIRRHSPRVIGVDLYRDVPVPPGGMELDEVFRSTPNLIGIFKFDNADAPGVNGPPALVGADRVGFSDLVLDSDAVVRRGLAFLDDGTSTAWSFPLKIALAFLAVEGIYITPDADNPEHFNLGPTRYSPLPARYGGYAGVDNAGYQFMLDYLRKPEDFPRYTFGDLLAGDVPGNMLSGRIVLLGVNAQSVKDSFVTPVSHWPWSPATQVSGIAMHGLVVDQLVRSGFGTSRAFSAWPPGLELALILLTCVAGAFAGLLNRSTVRLLVVTSSGIVALTLTGLVLFAEDVWFPVFPTAVGWTVAATMTTAYLLGKTRREREALQKILSLQVSAGVAEEIWTRRRELLDEGTLKPQNLTATVMFADLQGFTRLTEELPSEALITWLRPIMEAATNTVISHGGMVDDYFGDGIKVNFGVPIGRNDQAEVVLDVNRAIRCARALLADARRLTPGAAHPYTLRIGIHTGPVVAASVGSSNRWKYTTIGDTVNVAARLEALAKELSYAEAGVGNFVIVSAATMELADAGCRFDDLGQVSLRGRHHGVSAYRLLDDADPRYAPNPVAGAPT